MSSDTPPSSAPRQRSRGRRWLRRIVALCIVFAILLGIAALAIEIVLRSDLPRRLIVDALEQETGLRVEIASVDVGWFGDSTVSGVVVKLPLNDEKIFEAPSMKVRHAGILRVAITQDPGLAEVTIERPQVHMVEDEQGKWTLERAADIVQATMPAGSGGGALPKVDALDGTLHLRRSTGEAISVPLALHVHPQNSLVAKIEASVGGVYVAGKVTTTTWDQSLDIKAKDIEPIVSLWLADVPTPLAIDACWEGRLRGGEISGDLSLRRLRVGEHRAEGSIAVSEAAGAVTLRLNELAVRSPEIPGEHAMLHDGVVRVSGDAVTCEKLGLRVAGARGLLQGEWRYEPSSANAVLEWKSDAGNATLRHEGHIEVAARFPDIGEPAISAKIRTSGGFETLQWRANTSIDAHGPSLERLGIEVAAPELAISVGDEALELSGLRTSLEVNWPTITLSSLTLPNAATTTARGGIDMSTNIWHADVRLIGLADARLPLAPISIVAKASGDAGRVDVQHVEIGSARGEVSGSATYDAERALPLSADVTVRAPLPAEVDAVAADGAPIVVYAAKVAGTIDPLLVETSGVLDLPALMVGNGSIGPLKVPVDGLVASDSVSVRTKPVDILGGCASVEGTYLIDQSATAIRIDADEIPLDQLVALGVNGVTVEGNLNADVVIHVPDFDMDRAEVTGTWEVRDAKHDRWHVATGRGRVGGNKSGVRLHEMVLTKGDAEASGEVNWSGGVAQIDVQTKRWPIALADEKLAAVVDANVDLDVNVERRAASGKVTLHADAQLEHGPAAIDVAAEVDQRTIRASSLSLEVPGGRAHGAVTFPIDDWTLVNGAFDIERLDLSQIQMLLPPEIKLAGVATGTMSVSPSEDRRALEPLRIAVDLGVDDGSVYGLKLGAVRFVGYAGRDRAVLDRSDIMLAGGRINVWSRVSHHDGQPFAHVNVFAEDLNLNEIVHAVDPAIDHTPGRVDMRASLGGYLTAPHRAFGEANVSVRNAELQPIRAFEMLYSVLNIDLGKPKPEGEGEVLLRLDGDSLNIARFQYFNRGTDINGAGRIERLSAGTESPIDGVLVATLRPLKGSKLPFGPQLDRLLTGVLHDAASVKIGGTLSTPTTKIVPLADVVSFVQSVFGVSEPR